MLLALGIILWAGFWIGEVSISNMQNTHPTYAKVTTFLLLLFFWWLLVPLHALVLRKSTP